MSAPQIDRDAIRRIFMAHGFTIKEGQTDLKPYVYEAAEALLRELSPVVPQSAALADIAAERRRQIEQEGWTPEHDDKYFSGCMSTAAACYAIADVPHLSPTVGHLWTCTGWATKWFKPTFRRRNLVKAGALIAAEIERIDRAAVTAPESGSQQ